QFRAETDRGMSSVAERDLHADRPKAAFAEHISLCQQKPVNPIPLVAGPRDIHLRHASVTNPHGGPLLERSSGDALERMYEVAPLRIGISMFVQINPQTIAEAFLTQDKGQLLDHSGSFGVDDGAVG